MMGKNIPNAPSPSYPPTPKCTPAMSLMCERMKPGSKLVICWEFCQRADWFLLVFPSHVCTCRAETAMVISSSVNLSLLASLVKIYVSGWREWCNPAGQVVLSMYELWKRIQCALKPTNANLGFYYNYNRIPFLVFEFIFCLWLSIQLYMFWDRVHHPYVCTCSSTCSEIECTIPMSVHAALHVQR